MTECTCGNATVKGSMCSKCGTIYDKNGIRDIYETNDRIFEFLVYFSDINLFSSWNKTYKEFEKQNKQYLAIQKFREAIQTFLNNMKESDIIKTRDIVINSGVNHNISEEILMQLGFNKLKTI